jgi:hypothetical protein
LNVGTQVDQDELANVGRSIDRLVSVEIRVKEFSRRLVVELYEAARAAQGGGPLSLRAARALRDAAGPGEMVFIVTGTGDPETLPAGETDGPPGAAALASALSIGLGAVPILLTESEHLDNLSAVCRAAGLGLRPPEVARRVPDTCAMLPLAADDSAREQAERYLELFQPKAVVAIEKLAPNRLGVAHRASGKAAAASRARAEVLFDLARERGLLTIGVGDNGNEIGFGLIEPVVRLCNPYGARCRCPCEGGLAASVSTDILVAANTSNWGAYGVEAALAVLLGRPDLLHSAETERRMLETCVSHGGTDAGTGRTVPAVDGIPLHVNMAMVSVLDCIVRLGTL